jgi:4-hydroxy-tetrahydrodipicolinate synthase
MTDPAASPARFPGVHCVLYALFDAAERIDQGAMDAQVDHVLETGCDGITVLGLATEAHKLTLAEKTAIVEGTARRLSPDTPLSVTLSGNSVAEQRALAEVALACGARWLILQPPMTGTVDAAGLMAFFLRVAEGIDVPLAVQNAPQFLGRALSQADLSALRAHNPLFNHVKAEAPAADLSGLIAAAKPDLTVLTGRAGLEMTDCLRLGCEGFIVAPDTLAGVLRCHRAWHTGDEAAAEAAYAAVLPAATFAMQSLDHLVVYGKRIFAARAGITVHDRQPALAPTEAGLQIAARWAARAG